MSRFTVVAGIAALSLFAPAPVAAQNEADQQLGNVHFATTCNEIAQRRFDRAMRYQHSFWYRAAQEIFQESARADPDCAMAYWGMALSLLNNPHGPVPAPNLPLGLAAIRKAQAMGAKSQRERDYIDALALMYVDYDKLGHGPRIRAYLKAIEAVAAKYPDDDEAQIAYAITLNTSASPADKTYAQQLKGAALLEPISKRLPQHPGVTHYLIHLYDYPMTAAKGLDAANRYARIAPDAPHAQHMPSHIYTRVGYWKESIASNAASVKAAKGDKEYGDQMHGSDYMVYAYLQLGRDKEARALIDEMAAVTGYGPASFGAFFARAASPARYAVERSDWSGAAQLAVTTSQFPHVTAITHFARALGAARSGKPDAARAEVATLAQLRDKLREAKDTYWAEQVDIQWQVANAWTLNADGRHNEALRLLGAAADAEDKTEKAPVTPGPLAPARELYGWQGDAWRSPKSGPLAPARELYGQMLLERGMAKEAFAAFEASKAKEPNRFQGYVGAALAAAKLGDKAQARANYQKLVALAGAETERPEVAAARQYLASN